MRRVLVLLALAGAAAPAACSAFGGEGEEETLVAPPPTPEGGGGGDGQSVDGPVQQGDDEGGTTLPFDAGPVVEDAASCKATCAAGTKCLVDGTCRVDTQSTCGSPILLAAPGVYKGRVCKADSTSSMNLCPEQRMVHAFRIVAGINQVTIKSSGSLDFTLNKTCGGGGCVPVPPISGVVSRATSPNDFLVVGTGGNCVEYELKLDP